MLLGRPFYIRRNLYREASEKTLKKNWPAILKELLNIVLQYNQNDLITGKSVSGWCTIKNKRN